jgi:hypothetical protein
MTLISYRRTDPNSIGEWGVENKMKINPGKSKAVTFTKAGCR